MNNYSEESQPLDFERLVQRKNRPLPKAGCSWAFFIFLGLLIVGVIIMYILYRHTF